MKALIEISTGKILATGDALAYGGPWGKRIEEGTLKLVDAPDNERDDELAVVGGLVQVDAVKKAARVAKESGHSALLDKIKALKKSDLTTIDQCADAILDIAKVLRRMAKGD